MAEAATTEPKADSVQPPLSEEAEFNSLRSFEFILNTSNDSEALIFARDQLRLYRKKCEEAVAKLHFLERQIGLKISALRHKNRPPSREDWLFEIPEGEEKFISEEPSLAQLSVSAEVQPTRIPAPEEEEAKVLCPELGDLDYETARWCHIRCRPRTKIFRRHLVCPNSA